MMHSPHNLKPQISDLNIFNKGNGLINQHFVTVGYRTEDIVVLFCFSDI